MKVTVDEVARRLEKAGLACGGQRVLVGVSGGLDSVVLLDLLVEAGALFGIQLEVAHFDHGLRGNESTQDAQFVRELAATRGLPFHCGVLDAGETSAAKSESTEMRSRRLRHRFFADKALERDIRTIALGHHLDDQLETVFLRLFRGEGSSLGGMQAMGSSPANPDVRLFRPLLGLKRNEIAEWAARRGLVFREDQSNQNESFTRNRIRRQLIPLIRKEFGSHVLDGILRSSDISGATADWADREARKWLEKESGLDFGALPVALQRSVIRMQLLELKIETTFRRIEWLRRNVGQTLSTGQERALFRTENGRVQVAPRLPDLGMDISSCQVELTDEIQALDWGGVALGLRRVVGGQDFVEPPLDRIPGLERFDAEAVGQYVTLRHWRAGDRFQPIGMESPVKLQDLFVSAKIPAAQRRRLIIAEAEGRGIFWVEGLRIAEGFKLQSTSVRYLEWRWERRDAFLAAAHSTC